MRTTKRKIKSLRDLRKRKLVLQERMLDCERALLKDYLYFRSPLVPRASDSSSDTSGNSFFDVFYRLSMNAKRAVDIYRLLSSIYSDYKNR